MARINMKFADVFAGLGGFHKGLSHAGEFDCVFASEIDSKLRDLYELNFGLRPEGDIRHVMAESVPDHDVLCAGFPCQPFSVAGLKKGGACSKSGRLIDHVVRIARAKGPEFVFLENVPGLLAASGGVVWKELCNSLGKLGYDLEYRTISPVELGIPQNRKRLFVVGSLNHNLSRIFDWPKQDKIHRIDNFLGSGRELIKELEYEKKRQVTMWQQLLMNCNLPVELHCVSICAPEFGANYPVDFQKCTLGEMRLYRGSYGQSLENSRDWKEILTKLPSYCRKGRRVPGWLQQSVEFSRSVYARNRGLLDEWHHGINKVWNSWQILEWRGSRINRSLAEHLIQFRASGIRVMKSDKLPSLVAMTTTQVPIIGSEMRYLSKFEAAGLQNLHELNELPENESVAFRAIGNAVNAKVVEMVGLNLKKLNF